MMRDNTRCGVPRKTAGCVPNGTAMSAAQKYMKDSTGCMLVPENAVGLYDLWCKA